MSAAKKPKGRPVRRPRKPRKVRKAPKKTLKRFQPSALPEVPGRILALDVSSAAVGWAVFEESALVASGKWHPEGGAGAHGQKLLSYIDWLTIKLATYSPAHLVVERPFQGRNRNAYGVLMRYLGVAELCHFEHYCTELPDDNTLAPSEVKHQLGASRAGLTYGQRKQLMVDLVNDMYGLHLRYKARSKESDDDIADAIAVGHAWLSRLKRRKEQEDE